MTRVVINDAERAEGETVGVDQWCASVKDDVGGASHQGIVLEGASKNSLFFRGRLESA